MCADFPRTAAPDSTLGFLREGYAFIGKRCCRYGSDAFRTRIMFADVICMSGVEAAEIFYGGERFHRSRAMPVTVLKLLQDRGSVQSLEGAPHRHRKQLFLSLATGPAVDRLTALFADAWRRRLPAWCAAPEVVLYDEAFPLLTEAACAWAGLPEVGDGLRARSAELRSMVEGAGSIGPKTWRALLLRGRAERWARDRVRELRDSGEAARDDTPLHHLTSHRDLDGQLLPAEIVAVELLNLLRPTAAVAVFIVFAALALHEHPQWREAFADGEEGDLDGFVEEVRRLSPFFPAIGGRARRTFDWRGRPIEKDQWVLLDLYGTCRDPGAWEQPEAFRPERHHRQDDPGPYSLVPQGGGEHLTSHRCPGEWVTIALMKEAVRLLSRTMSYSVPPQDLMVRLNRMPGRPESGFVMAGIRQPAAP